MPPQEVQSPPPVTCSLLLLLATPTEEKGLKQAATDCNIQCTRVKAKNSSLQVEFYDLGTVGAESRVIALPPARTDDNELVMGAMGFFGSAARAMRLRVATGAQSIVQVGMAFGIDPERQKIGDVLVSTSLIPYDNRIVQPLIRECGKCGEPAAGFMTDYKEVTREHGRPSLVSLFRREQARREQAGKTDYQVYLGAMLSGAARIHCRCYRDEVAQGVRPGEDLIVGGEMEGVGLLAASVAWGDPIWCVVKGICDFADEDRGAVIREAREGACRNAASFVLSSLVNDAVG
jgi:nucleoside phosphorylase